MPRHSPTVRAFVGIGLLLAGTASGDAQSESKPALRQLSAATPAGTRYYAPGTWGLVEVGVANRSEQPAKVLSSLYFTGDPNRQYGRELWVPPGARRRTWYPVLVPADISTDSMGLGFEAFFFDRTGPEERFVPTPSGRMLSDGLLPVDREGRISGWIGSEDSASDELSHPSLHDMIVAARFDAGLSRKLISFRGLVLPPSSATLQGMEHLVLSGDRPLSDPAGLAAIRQWVARGGRLWVVLNDVSPATVERLLGNGCRIQEVDRVGLTEVRIEGVGSAGWSSDREARQFEEPVELVRVLADGVEVLHTVDGWPASFVQKFGRGEVLFTTVGPQGWVRPSRPNDQPPPDRLGETGWRAGEPLEHLANRLMGVRAEPADSTDIWKPFLSEQIGYRIADRGTVLGVLGLSCIALTAASVWLGRRGRLDRMGWAAPLISLAAAGALAAVGLRSTRAVPSTIAEGQLIETIPGSAEVQVSGLLMLYSQTTTEPELGATGGGIFVPDMTGFAEEPRRMVWTDWDEWHWENMTLPRGVRIAPFRKDMRLESPVAAQGEFGPNGFSGKVVGLLEGLSDPVLTTPSGGKLAPRLGSGGAFTAGSQDVLAPGAFLAETLLSDTQRRRQDLYRRVLRPEAGKGRYGDRPTLLAWMEPLNLGFVLPKGSERVGEALVALPLKIEKTPPGTSVVIPSPFVNFDPVPGPGGKPPSILYDERAGEWAEYSGDIESWMRFQMPEEVVPLDLSEAELSLAVTGAITRLELVVQTNGRTETLRTWENPVGTLRVAIRRPDVLELDEQGGLLLGLRVHGVGEPVAGEDAELRQYWRIEAVRLAASGRTSDVSARD